MLRGGAEPLQGFVGTRNGIRAVLVGATAANICTDERQVEAGVVPPSRGAILELLRPCPPASPGEQFQPRDSVSLLLQRCSAQQDFSFVTGENILLLIQQVMKLFLEETLHSCMVINTLLSHSYSVPI